MDATDLVNSPTYYSWSGMKARCFYEKHEAFDNYGGRGITVCDKWLKFAGFLEDMGVKPAGKELDRIDPNGNYEPSNCRWVTRQENVDNRRCTQMITHNGVTKPLTHWARDLGITRKALKRRLDRNWPVSRAVTTGKLENGQKIYSRYNPANGGK